MIRYALACENGHGFDSWFRDSASFDDLAGKGLVSCPQCGAAKVRKQIMSPSVARTDRDHSSPKAEPVNSAPQAEEISSPQPAAGTSGPVALLGEREKAFRDLLKAVRDHVLATAENVGPRFAEEARRMHEGLSEFKAIYGEASVEEARALAEEGIDAIPLPMSPSKQN
jgi:hypothetical protein